MDYITDYVKRRNSFKTKGRPNGYENLGSALKAKYQIS